MATSNQKVVEVVKLYVDKISCYCHTHDAEKYSENDMVTKLQVHPLINIFQQTW